MSQKMKTFSVGETKPQTLIASVAQTLNPKHGYKVFYAPKQSAVVKDTDFQPFHVKGDEVIINQENPLFVTTLPGTYGFSLAQQTDVTLHVSLVDYLVTARGEM